MTNLPQPTNAAADLAAITASLVGDVLTCFLPGGGTISRSIEIFQNRKIEAARKMLFDEVAAGNIQLLRKPEYEALIPNVFAYFDAARSGEYEHNMKILARLLVEQVVSEEPDSMVVKRSARRLEGMGIADLGFLTTLASIYDAKRTSQEFDGYHLFADDSDVVRYEAREYVSPEQSINSKFSDAASRGLLFLGGDPRIVGGQVYYPTDSFYEIVRAASAVESNI
ncbi:hypothetical protein BO068_004895 [Escherichia coli]|nr:hypothetical protein [Escherichia coli]